MGIKVHKAGEQIKLLEVVSVGEFNFEGLREELRLELDAFAVSAGKLLVEGIMRAEVESVAGSKYTRKTEGIDRWGHQPGYAIIGGQKVPVKRPRLRTSEGNEMGLESYERFQDQQMRTSAVLQRLIAGISCRSYPKTVESFSEGYGISKSVINREAIAATSEELRQLVERDLSTFKIVAMLIDGIRVGQTLLIVALGVDIAGTKQILGFREGSSETADVCVSLLEDMVRRGLRSEGRPLLVVIDGSKALRAAVDRFFGAWAVVQRCEIHKRRNVLSHLSEKYQAHIGRKLDAAYKMKTFDQAKSALLAVVKELEFLNHSAAASLLEGLDETLTVHALELPELLRTTFASTNLIESAFSRARTVLRNVKRWKNSSQVQRWTATALVSAEKGFRKVRGYRTMPVLLNALVGIAKERGLAINEKIN